MNTQLLSTVLSTSELDLLRNNSPQSYVAFTFFVGTMAMMAASVFFFFEMRNVAERWRTSMLVSGLITFIAAVHYYYMRGFYMEYQESPTFFRYVDWLLTVPLMCVEFYLITKKAGAKQGLLWKLIFASVVMLVTGYWGEAVAPKQAALWGFISGAAYFSIVWMVWKGEVSKLSKASSPAVQKAVDSLLKFVVIGWGIYPLGYLVGTAGSGPDTQWYASMMEGLNLNMDVIYNIGDAVNKIGFGLVIYALTQADKD